MADVRTPGLFRCCVNTALEAEPGEEEGQVLACKYCTWGRMIWRDGAWEWDQREQPQ